MKVKCLFAPKISTLQIIVNDFLAKYPEGIYEITVNLGDDRVIPNAVIVYDEKTKRRRPKKKA